MDYTNWLFFTNKDLDKIQDLEWLETFINLISWAVVELSNPEKLEELKARVNEMNSSALTIDKKKFLEKIDFIIDLEKTKGYLK